MHTLLLNIHAHHMHTHQASVGLLHVIQIAITIWLRKQQFNGRQFICTFNIHGYSHLHFWPSASTVDSVNLKQRKALSRLQAFFCLCMCKWAWLKTIKKMISFKKQLFLPMNYIFSNLLSTIKIRRTWTIKNFLQLIFWN